MLQLVDGAISSFKLPRIDEVSNHAENQSVVINQGETSEIAKPKRVRHYKKEDAGRGFQNIWFWGHPHLRVLPIEEQHPDGTKPIDVTLICNACCLVHSGITTIRTKLDAIKEHNSTVKHQKSLAAIAADTADVLKGEYSDLAYQTTLHFSKSPSEGLQSLDVLFGTANMNEVEKKEFARKEIQFRIIFDILQHHRPMTDYEWLQDMLAAHPTLKKTNFIPKKHVSDNSGWDIADAMNAVMVKSLQDLVEKAPFLSISIDASAAENNRDYLDIETRYI